MKIFPEEEILTASDVNRYLYSETYELAGAECYVPTEGSLGSWGAHAVVTEFTGGFKRVSLAVHHLQMPTSGVIAHVPAEIAPSYITAGLALSGANFATLRLSSAGELSVPYCSGPSDAATFAITIDYAIRPL